MWRSIQNKKNLTTFKRWSRRKEAVLLSLGRVIRIGVLSFSLTIVVKPAAVFSQKTDSISATREIDLEEVEIISEGSPEVFSQIARTVSIISSSEISSSPATTIQDLLETVAGIDIRQRNTHGVQADLQLRGGTFDQVLILLNGINITDPQTGHFNLNFPVELSMVERIEILHGSASRIYGANAYKGVINIITKDDWTGLKAGIQLGQHELIHSYAGLGASFKKHYHSLGVSRNSTKGYAENTDYNIRNLFYEGGLKLKMFDLVWQSGANDKTYGASNFYSPSFPDQYEETRTGFGSVKLSTKGKIKMDVSGWIRRHNDHFLLKRNEPRFYENFHQTNISGIKIQNYFKSKLGYSYIGLESRNENILSNILGEDMNDSIRVNGTTDAYYYKQFRRNYTGIFLEQKINLNNFYISGGFLINYNREYDRNWNIFPGLDLSYQFPELNLKLFASAGRSLRLPTFTDMFYSDPVNQGNPSLQPEELLSFESGLEYRNGNFSTGLSIFSDYGKNVIDWVIFQGNSVYEAQNISNVNSRGVETNIQFLNEDPVGKLAISNTSLSYAFTGQELLNGDWESKYAGDFLKSKFTSQIQFVLFHHFYLKYNLVFQSRNGSFIDVDDNSGARFSVAFKPYWISDIKFSFKQRNYSLFIKASNLFNTEYNDVGNLIQPGRWISGGMELSF